ncbi:MAG: hypothetical protein ACREB8_06070, partial [Pseudolabrys sp.]
MADNETQRPYRSNEPPARAPSSASNPASDPLAELARLIGQTDPFAEFGRDTARRAAPPQPTEPPAVRAAAPEAPPPAQNFGANNYFGAPPLPTPAAQPPTPAAHETYPDPAYAASVDPYHAESATTGYPAGQGQGYETGGYPQQLPHDGEEEDFYDDVPPPRRRMGIMAIAAVFALAVIGTAGAFGYRALFGDSRPSQPPPVIKADTAPSKIIPPNAGKAPNKQIYDRVADYAQGEKIVSREEQPIEMKTPSMAMPPASDSEPPAPVPAAAPLAALGSGIVSTEPKKIHTIVIRADQIGMAASQPVEPPAPAPAPVAPPPPRVTAAVPPARETPRQVASSPPIDLLPNAAPDVRAREPRAIAPPVHRVAAPPVRRAEAPANVNAPLSLSPYAGEASAAAAPPARAPVRTALATAQPAPTRVSHAAGGSYAVQVSSQRSEAD